MAALAVRKRDADPLVRGLIALGVAGLDRSKKAMMRMAPIEHSIELLGLDGGRVFGEVIEIVGEPTATSLRKWRASDPESRTLAATRLVAIQEADGIRYAMDR